MNYCGFIMTNALYLSFSGYSEYNGISKKKLAQIKALKECGWNVVNCYYTICHYNNHCIWMMNNDILVDLKMGILAKIKKRTNYSAILSYIIKKNISFVYIRSEHNATPFFIRFVKRLRNKGIKVVMEIPTFPYDQEYIDLKDKCSLFIDKLFRKSLAKQLNAIVTFSNESNIFGQRTIRISNGIDFNSIKLKQKRSRTSNEIHLIAVAEIHYWHGIDRIVAGIANYYQSGRQNSRTIYLHIVGEFSGERERDEIFPLIVDNQLENYVFLYGKLFGTALDEMFDQADIGIGSLARHRSNITYIKTLKNREYTARGLPFIYSEIDEDFEEMPYILKAPADDSPIDIDLLLEFYDHLTMTAEEIRSTVHHLAWKNQMQRVLDSVS